MVYGYWIVLSLAHIMLDVWHLVGVVDHVGIVQRVGDRTASGAGAKAECSAPRSQPCDPPSHVAAGGVDLEARLPQAGGPLEPSGAPRAAAPSAALP